MGWSLWRRALVGCVLACIGWLQAAPARAETEVDLALVIAVDISYSMDPEEQNLQREGFAEAFRSPLVHDAIRGGMLGRIAVLYMEWAGAFDQRVVLPWTVIDNAESVDRLVLQLRDLLNAYQTRMVALLRSCRLTWLNRSRRSGR